MATNNLSFVLTPSTHSFKQKHFVQRWHCPQVRICARQTPISMAISRGQVSLYAGAIALSGILFNRLFLTPLNSLALSQSRSDILGVISGAALVLYGVGKADIAAREAAAAEIKGENVNEGLSDKPTEIQWSMRALLSALPAIQSVALLSTENTQLKNAYLGKFQTQDIDARMRTDGIVEGVLQKGERAYLADLKIVPTRDIEFGFLPKDCKSVIVQPISTDVALVLGADRPRPFTATDFGWLQAISNNISSSLDGDQSV